VVAVRSRPGQPEPGLPSGLGKPAERALAQAGYIRLAQFTSITEADLLRLHGVGPRAAARLKHALDEHGLSFRDGRLD
jgi:predicted flap endonuclease-1-like 5' DNA nuclease